MPTLYDILRKDRGARGHTKSVPMLAGTKVSTPANSPNIPKDLLPGLGNFEEIVYVIDVPMATGRASAKVVADPETSNAV